MSQIFINGVKKCNRVEKITLLVEVVLIHGLEPIMLGQEH